MQSDPAYHLRHQNQPKIDLMDSMRMQFYLTTPERIKYDALVKKKLEAISTHLKNNKYSKASQLFIQLGKDLSAEEFWQQWGRINLQIRFQTFTSEFMVFFEELKQVRKEKQKLESEAKTRYVSMFIQKKSVEDNKTALLNMLSFNRLKLGLELAQRIPQLNAIGQLIKEILQYRWLVSRHQAYNKSIYNTYSKWRYQEMVFDEERSLLKAFIDEQYRTSDNRNQELEIIQEKYFETKNFQSSYDLLGYKFKKEIIKQILQSHFYQYQYMEWFKEAQKQLIRNKILEENYSKGRQSDRALIIQSKIENIMKQYFKAKSESKITSKYESKLTFQTNKSSIVSDYLEINQDQSSSIIYNQISVKELYQKNKVLMQQLLQLQDTQMKMKGQIDRLDKQVTELNEKNRLLKQQNRTFSQQLQIWNNQKKNINIQTHTCQESVSFCDDESYVERIFPELHTDILQEHKREIINIFSEVIPCFTLQGFQKIYQYPEVIYKEELSQRLADCIQRRNHLLFAIKLAEENKVITAFVERGVVFNHDRSLNRSEISQFQNLHSQINHRGVQSDVLLDRNNSSVFTSQETPEKGLIIAHWKNNQRFVPVKRMKLLTVDFKSNRITIGLNDLVILLGKGEVRSNIGKDSKKGSAFECQSPKKTEDNSFLGEKGPASGVKFERVQIFHLKYNNDVDHSFKRGR